MDFVSARRNMVESQLRPSNVTEPRLLDAMGRVPRERFVPSARRAMAYCDGDVEIAPAGDEGDGPRYLMQPMAFGRLVQLSGVGRRDLVLDIGCGTGYSAAILGHLADSVVAVERDEHMVEEAGTLLGELGVDNAAVLVGRLVDGYPQEGPYDLVVLEGAVDGVPPELFDQLADNGRLAAVVNEPGGGRCWLYRKSGDAVSGRAGPAAEARRLPGFEAAEEAFAF